MTDSSQTSQRGITIRAAARADVPRVWEMVLALAVYERMSDRVTGSAEQLARDLAGERPVFECLVAEYRDALVGYALFYPTYSSFRAQPMMWLEDLFVEPSARNLGIGDRLMAAVARRALERGCVRLDWHVLDWNQLALDFYERLGATRVDVEWLQFGVGGEELEALASAETT